MNTVAPEDCPEPFWHKTHRYCPCCSWVDEERQPPTANVAVDLNVATIDALRAKLAATEAERDLWHERAERVATTRNVINNEANRLNAELSAVEVKMSAMEAVVAAARELRSAREERTATPVPVFSVPSIELLQRGKKANDAMDAALDALSPKGDQPGE